jgi:hypothetical protein
MVLLLWWFIKGDSSVSAAEPYLPSMVPPPPLPDPSIWMHPLLLLSGAISLASWLPCIFSYIRQFRAHLPWWFIKRCIHVPAAEPSLSPSPRPPPACGSLHKYILLLAFLPTVDASSVTAFLPGLNYILWSLACHSGHLLTICWSNSNWMLPWAIVILSLTAIPVLAIVWINQYLYPLIASAARVPARWYCAPILPAIFGTVLLLWIQFIKQHQPNSEHLTLGRWICTPLYYLLFRGFIDDASNLVDRLLVRLLLFDNYSDLRLSLLPSLEDGCWLHTTVRRPNRKAHDWRRCHGRKPLPSKITVISGVSLPSFGVIIRFAVRLFAYGIALQRTTINTRQSHSPLSSPMAISRPQGRASACMLSTSALPCSRL